MDTMLTTPAAPAPAIFVDPEDFVERFLECYEEARGWTPHRRFSVFTQWDGSYYLDRYEEFMHKYRVFFSVARALRPRKIVELGTYAGSGADAYLSGWPHAEYLGVDLFDERVSREDGTLHAPYEIARALFQDRGYACTRLFRTDLRSLERLPESSEFVVVDAAHDTYNEYEDLRLALTANPRFIWVDDSDAEDEARPAIQRFLHEDVAGRVMFTVGIDYTGGGLLIALKEHGE
jgi:hypothetical protein